MSLLGIIILILVGIVGWVGTLVLLLRRVLLELIELLSVGGLLRSAVRLVRDLGVGTSKEVRLFFFLLRSSVDWTSIYISSDLRHTYLWHGDCRHRNSSYSDIVWLSTVSEWVWVEDDIHVDFVEIPLELFRKR